MRPGGASPNDGGHEEVAILERRLKTLSGLESLHADILGQRLNIKYDAAKLSASTIAEAVAQTGMRAWLEHEQPARPAPSAATRRTFVMASGLLAGAGMALEYAGIDHRAVVATYALSIASGMPIEIAQQNLGHASLATTTVYVTTEKRRRMQAVEAFWKR